jgi:hypothetical protein
MNTTVEPQAIPPTTVHGPMIQPMSVAKSTRSVGPRSAWYAVSRAIESRNPPWTWRAPFGFPVVPDVYAMRYGDSLSRGTAPRTPGRPSTASSHQRSRPESIGHGAPARRHTTTCSTVGASTSASSSTSFMGTSRPRR